MTLKIYGVAAREVQRSRVGAVHVLEHAVLLHHEDRRARLQDVVDLARGKLVETREPPGDHTAAFGLATLARCSHVSTTVSGLSDIDSMPSCISHSARSG